MLERLAALQDQIVAEITLARDEAARELAALQRGRGAVHGYAAAGGRALRCPTRKRVSPPGARSSRCFGDVLKTRRHRPIIPASRHGSGGSTGPRTDHQIFSRPGIRPVLFDTTQLALERAIGGAAQRHTALANNLANVNTPGYQRVDVDFHGTLAAAMAGGDPRAAVERTAFSAERDAHGDRRARTATAVDADAEAAKLAANALEQQAAVSVAHTRIQILRSAMGVW